MTMLDSPVTKMQLNILTPRGVKFEREADYLSMRALDGEIGILPNHAPMTAILGDGILRIRNNQAEEKLALFEGIVEVRNNIVNIYTTIAQRPEEIDMERALRDKEEAEASLRSEAADLDIQTALLEIRRALVRLEVAVHSEDKGYFDNIDADLTDDV